MRLVIVSDTHDQYHYTVPDGDVLIHCGDFTLDSTRDEFERFNDWCARLSHRVIAISGNHESALQEATPYGKLLLPNCIYLEDSGVEIGGVKFYGSPWTPWFYDYAFNFGRYDDAQARRTWAKIPEDTDVLITHGPPHGRLDMLPRDKEHVGDRHLRERVDAIKPALHAFGHIHVARGVLPTKETLFVNAAMCNEQYHLVRKPVVVDLERRNGRIVAEHVTLGA